MKAFLHTFSVRSPLPRLLNSSLPLWVRGHPRIDSLPLLQVVKGDQNRTRAYQRLKTGDLRRPPYLLFGSFMVVVLAYSQFPYRTKEQNTIPEEGPPVWSGK